MTGFLLLFQSSWICLLMKPSVLVSPSTRTYPASAVLLESEESKEWNSSSPLIYLCFLLAVSSGASHSSVSLESACSLWVNYVVVSVCWRDLLTGKCNGFFHVDCDSYCPLFWTVPCFLKSSLLWPTVCFLSGAAHMSATCVSVISSVWFFCKLVIRWLSSVLQKSWPLQWSQG